MLNARIFTATTLALTDASTSQEEKAVARLELKKLGVTVSENASKAISKLAVCPVSVGNPTDAAVIGAAVFKNSIGVSGRTVLANTVEFAGGAHYNNHPDRTIGHWIVGYGYSSSAATLNFADPATGLTGYTGKQKFSIKASDFGKFLGNGLVA